MLTANETIAEKFFWLEAPFIYRVHEDPDYDKIQETKPNIVKVVISDFSHLSRIINSIRRFFRIKRIKNKITVDNSKQRNKNRLKAFFALRRV